MPLSAYTSDACAGSNGTPVDGRSFNPGPTGTWADPGGTFEIQSNTILSNASGQRQTVDADSLAVSDDMSVAMKLTSGRGSGSVRFTHDAFNGDTFYFVDNVPAVFALLKKCVDNSFTTIGTAGTIAALGDVLKLEIIGDEIRFLINGTPVTWVESGTTILTDASIGPGGGWGVRGEDWSGGNFGFDDYAVETAASGFDGVGAATFGGLASAAVAVNTDPPPHPGTGAATFGGLASAGLASSNNFPGGIEPDKWFDGNSIVAVDGAAYTTWPDQMGGSSAAGVGTVYKQAAFGSYPGVQFDGSTSYMSVPLAWGDYDDGITIFVVYRNRTFNTAMLSKDGAGADFMFGIETNTGVHLLLNGQEPADLTSLLHMMPHCSVDSFTYSKSEGKTRVSRGPIVQEDTAAGGDMGITGTTLIIGAYGDAHGAKFKGVIQAVIVYPALSAADAALVRADLRGTRHGLSAMTGVVVEGDSFTDVGGGSTHVIYALDLFQKSYGLMFNNARGGSVLTGGATNIDSRLAGESAYVDPARPMNVYTLAHRTNDANDRSTGTMASQLTTHLANVALAGFTDVLLGTLVSRRVSISFPVDKAGWDAMRIISNADIRGRNGTGIVRGLIDFADDPTIGTNAAYDDPGVSADGVHPDAIYQADPMAQIFATALDSLPLTAPSLTYDDPIVLVQNQADDEIVPANTGGPVAAASISGTALPAGVTLRLNSDLLVTGASLVPGTTTGIVLANSNSAGAGPARTLTIQVLDDVPVSSLPAVVTVVVGSTGAFTVVNTGNTATALAEVAGATSLLATAGLEIKTANTIGAITAPLDEAFLGTYPDVRVRQSNAAGNGNTVSFTVVVVRASSDEGGAIQGSAVQSSAIQSSAIEGSAIG